jgi:hypothetical protein
VCCTEWRALKSVINNAVHFFKKAKQLKTIAVVALLSQWRTIMKNNKNNNVKEKQNKKIK